MKKSLALLLVLVMVIFNSINTFAANTPESDNYLTRLELASDEELPNVMEEVSQNISFEELSKMEGTVIGNEYDIYLSLAQKNDLELQEIGFTTADIDEFRAIDPKSSIKRLSKLSTFQLEQKGYDTQEAALIQSIKNVEKDKITDSMMRAASAQVAMQLTYNGYRISGNTTNATLICVWSWSQSPVFTFKDIIAIGWGKGLSSDTSASGSYTTITERNISDGKINSVYNLRWTDKSPNAGVSLTYNIKNLYVTSGVSTIKIFDKDRAINNFEARSEYGHSTLTANPSVSFSAGGAGIGISFSRACESIAYDTVSLYK